MTPITGSGSEKGHILLVEDEPTLLETQAELLRRMGYAVETSADPIHAVSIFNENPHRFGLVIADEIMPHMRGTEMAVLMRAVRPDLPFVIVTAGLNLEMTRESAEAAQISHVFLKPLERASFETAIKTILP